MKKGWWIDTLLGVALTLVVMGAAFFDLPFTESLENKLYDARLRFSPKSSLSDQILLVAVDDASITAVGRWPWPRGYVARLIERISAGGPRVIGLNILYVDPDQNQGLAAVREIKGAYETALAGQEPLFSRVKADARYRGLLAKAPLDSFQDVGALFDEAERGLDNDAQLAEVLKATPRLVLPLAFTLEKPIADETDEVLDRLKAHALAEAGPSDDMFEGHEPLAPLPEFAQGAAGFGHINLLPDGDGSVRREAPLARYRGKIFLSLSLEMARVSLGLKPGQVEVVPGREVRLGDQRVPLGSDNRLLINYQGPFSSLNVVPAAEVLAGRVAPGAFKNKLVLVGITATGLGPTFVSPMEPASPANGIISTVLQNVLGGAFLTRPDWTQPLELGLLLVLGLFATLLLPLLRARIAALVTAALLGLIVVGGFYLFMSKGYWIKVFYPAALLGLAYTMVTARRFFFTEKRKELVEAESIETNKMLGLSFQGQGMLDLAFEKFRKCPLDDAMKELLYNLALDFERKRQFNKAGAVYEHVGQADPDFKDIKDRRKTMKAASETMIAGPGLGGARREGTVVVEGAAVKPTLGRYEIEKELGRGAMGVVYLGKDPKINRMVAIKTLRFEDDVDEETAKEIKARFFREAESAGTLNHPNIVRIFDAGEDNDVSYIAMELLAGEDLKKYGEKANLLPVPQVIEYVGAVADALDYAHAHGVVHRDIKPANIMRLKDGSLRVTDFGIARITASSKTQTGTVLGTPSYMSPEQVAGKKVDGRADLFSLGVMFYELMTGEKPFGGDSIATLLFQIANEPHPDPLAKAGGRVTPAVKAVLDRALRKKPEERYQTGKEMAAAVRGCLQAPSAPAPAAPAAPEPPASPPAAQETQRVKTQEVKPVEAKAPPAPERPKPVPAPAPAPQDRTMADTLTLSAKDELEQQSAAPAPKDPAATQRTAPSEMSSTVSSSDSPPAKPPAPPPSDGTLRL